ncbi:regulatory protein RecX [Lacinutrix undariae]
MNTHKTYTVIEATEKLKSYCAYQERCHKEVKEKLRSLRMIDSASDVIINSLIQDNFLNETRYATSFARGKFRIKKWGRNRIKLELKRRDIGVYNINMAMKEISDADYLSTFYELANKKADTLTETDIWKKRKKLSDYLLYRGWESHLIYEAMNDIIKP